jgi:hypothetical protein
LKWHLIRMEQGLRWCNRQSKRLSPLRSWVRFSLRNHALHLCEKSQSTLYRNSCVLSGFLPQWVLTGWVGIILLTDSSTVAVLRDQTWIVRWLPCIDTLRKPSTRSGWAASFVIQLSSQLIRMISTPHLLTCCTYYLKWGKLILTQSKDWINASKIKQ